MGFICRYTVQTLSYSPLGRKKTEENDFVYKYWNIFKEYYFSTSVFLEVYSADREESWDCVMHSSANMMIMRHVAFTTNGKKLIWSFISVLQLASILSSLYIYD